MFFSIDGRNGRLPIRGVEGLKSLDPELYSRFARSMLCLCSSGVQQPNSRIDVESTHDAGLTTDSCGRSLVHFAVSLAFRSHRHCRGTRSWLAPTTCVASVDRTTSSTGEHDPLAAIQGAYHIGTVSNATIHKIEHLIRIKHHLSAALLNVAERWYHPRISLPLRYRCCVQPSNHAFQCQLDPEKQ